MPNNPLTPDPTAPGTQGSTVTLTFSTVPALPLGQSPFQDDPPGQSYWAYGITAVRFRDSGLSGAPVAGVLGTPSAFWRCSGGESQKVIQFGAARFGTPPAPPNADTGNPNDVLKDDLLVMATEIMPDGSLLYILMGQYVYLQQQRPADSDPLIYPNSPLLQPFNTILIPAQFQTGLIPDNPPSGFSGGAITY